MLSVVFHIPGAGIPDRQLCSLFRRIPLSSQVITQDALTVSLSDRMNISAPFQITVNHGLLFVGKQQQVKILLFVAGYGMYSYHISEFLV